MSRPLRIDLVGGLYHVTSRGDGRDDSCHFESDGVYWLDVSSRVRLYDSAAGRGRYCVARPDPRLRVALHSERSEKSPLGLAHSSRVALAVQVDVSSHPLHMRLLSCLRRIRSRSGSGSLGDRSDEAGATSWVSRERQGSGQV